MIISFRHTGLRAFVETGSKAGVVAQHAARLCRILGVLDAAQTIDQVNTPGYVCTNSRGAWLVSGRYP